MVVAGQWWLQLLVAGAVLRCQHTVCQHTAAAGCNVSQRWDACTRRFADLGLVDRGWSDEFGFGWRPLRHVRTMCKWRPQVRVLQCLHSSMTECARTSIYVILQLVMDYRMYDRAAQLICQERTLSTFEEEVGCLLEARSGFRICTQQWPPQATIDSATREIEAEIADTSNRTLRIRLSKRHLLSFINSTVARHLCQDRRQLIGCVGPLLSRCPVEMRRTVVNYYKHLAPGDCDFGDFAGSFAAQPMGDQGEPGRRSRDRGSANKLQGDKGGGAALRVVAVPQVAAALLWVLAFSSSREL